MWIWCKASLCLFVATLYHGSLWHLHLHFDLSRRVENWHLTSRYLDRLKNEFILPILSICIKETRSDQDKIQTILHDNEVGRHEEQWINEWITRGRSLSSNKFHVNQCQAQIEIWHSPDVQLTFTWPPDHHLTFPLHNLNQQFSAQKKLSGGGWRANPLQTLSQGPLLTFLKRVQELTRTWERTLSLTISTRLYSPE